MEAFGFRVGDGKETGITKIGRLIARTLIGGLFIGHGTQKLFGWFGGPGLTGTEQMMAAIDMRPTRPNAVVAGATETVGGALLAAGLATPLASTGLIGTMVTAIRTVHLKNGPWAANGGYEYNLVLIAGLLALADGDPKDASLDRALGLQLTGPQWALAALATGAAASTLAIEMGRRTSARVARSAPPVGAVPDVAGDPGTAQS